MNLQPVAIYDTIWSEVFAFEVHVDRHVIFGAASTDGRHEVDGDYAALFLDQGGGVVCDKQVHKRVNPLKRSRISSFYGCLLYTSPSPRDATLSRMPSSA